MLSAEARIADHEAELASMKAGGSGGAAVAGGCAVSPIAAWIATRTR